MLGISNLQYNLHYTHIWNINSQMKYDGPSLTFSQHCDCWWLTTCTQKSTKHVLGIKYENQQNFVNYLFFSMLFNFWFELAFLILFPPMILKSCILPGVLNWVNNGWQGEFLCFLIVILTFLASCLNYNCSDLIAFKSSMMNSPFRITQIN